MRTLLISAIIVAVVCFVEGKHDKHAHLRKGPSAVPFHRGEKDFHHGHKRGHGHKDLLHTKLRGKHGKISVDGDDWLSASNLKYSHGCKNCPAHHVCVVDSERNVEKCLSKHNIKEGRRLFKSFHDRKVAMEGHMKPSTNQLLSKSLDKAEHMKEAYELMKQYRAETPKHLHMEKPHSKLSVKVSHQHHNEHTVEKASSKHPSECQPKDLYDIRTRLTGLFVTMHTQKRQKHHHMMKSKKHKRSTKSGHKHGFTKIQTEKHGHCKCSKSDMWAFRHFDSSRDRHLSHDEILQIDENRNEPCIHPFLKACDSDMNGKLSKQEWCCCLADVIPPCAEKLRLTDKSSKDTWTPRCDREGFYEREQCDHNGYCWCSDLNGNEIPNTKQLHNAHCGKYDPAGNVLKV